MNGIVNFLGLFKTFVHAKGALDLRNFPLISGLLTKLAEPLREILQGGTRVCQKSAPCN